MPLAPAEVTVAGPCGTETPCRAWNKGYAGREGHSPEESPGEPSVTSRERWMHFWFGLPVIEQGGEIQRAWQRAAGTWPSRERTARNTSPQLFLLQSVPWGASPEQLELEAHALPCGAAETTRNIPPHTLLSKRNMMQRKYCPNLYWNLFLTRLTTQTPMKTKGYRTHEDGEQGELYNELKRTDAPVSLGWNQPRGREQRHRFPRGFSHVLAFVLHLLIPQVSKVESCPGLVRVLFSRQ